MSTEGAPEGQEEPVLQELFKRLCIATEDIGRTMSQYRELRALHARLSQDPAYTERVTLGTTTMSLPLVLDQSLLPHITRAAEEAGGSLYEGWLEAKQICDQCCQYFESLYNAASTAAGEPEAAALTSK